MKADLQRLGAWAAVLIATWSLTACAQFNHAQPNSPLARSTVPAITPAPRVALVLGSGGPRGYAHIGVMRVPGVAGHALERVVGPPYVTLH